MGCPELMGIARSEGAHGRERRMGAKSKRVTVAPSSTAMTRSQCSSLKQGQVGGGLGTLRSTWPPEEVGSV